MNNSNDKTTIEMIKQQQAMHKSSMGGGAPNNKLHVTSFIKLQNFNLQYVTILCEIGPQV